MASADGGESRELAPIGGRGIVIPEEWGLDIPIVGVSTSIDIRTESGKLRLFKVLQGKGKDIKEAINLVIDVADFVITPAGRVDPETGELQKWPRTLLVSPDGDFYHCGSRGIIKSLILISQLVATAPWIPPLKLRVNAENIEGGKQWYTLELTELPKGKKK